MNGKRDRVSGKMYRKVVVIIPELIAIYKWDRARSFVKAYERYVR